MMSKRILMLNYEFPPLGGGAGNATKYILKEFAKFPDVHIDLVTSSVDIFHIEQIAPNIRIHFLDIGKRSNAHYQSMRDLLTYSWKAYWYSKKLISQTRFDLCHAFFGIPCGFIAMFLGLPYIVSLRGSDVPFHNKRYYWLDTIFFKHLSKYIWSRAVRVVANSHGLKSFAQTSIPGQGIEVIPNGVDINIFKPHEKKSYTTNLTLISVGRLVEQKGYKYLVEALRGLSSVELILVGDGPLRGALSDHARMYSVSVKFMGSVMHDDIPRILRDADVFILPSLNEGMSNAILEAMACGLPIITTDTGGAIELITKNGYVVPKAHSIALQEAVTVYLNNRHLVIQHGLHSRTHAEGMSWQIVTRRYYDLYQQIYEAV